jgi:WD40 repeat protein
VGVAAITPDGKFVATGDTDGRVIVRSAAGRTLMEIPATGNPVNEVALTPDGRTVAWTTADGVFRARVGGRPAPTHPGLGSATPTTLAMSPRSQEIAIGTADGATMIWRADGSLNTIANQSGEIYGLSFSANGRYLASAGADQHVRVFDLSTSAPPVVLAGHTDAVLDVAFAGDDRYLASVGFDGVRLWDWRRGVVQLNVPSGTSHDQEVAVSPSGLTAVVLDDGGTVHQLTCDVCVPQSRLLTLAGVRVTRDLTTQERTEFLSN